MIKLRFLGVGNAFAASLGNSSAVLEIDNKPRLLIDCGGNVPDMYAEAYGGICPEALFITHTHFDHIAGMEALFYKLACTKPRPPLVKLFVPVSIITRLHQQLAEDRKKLAEGGMNFWDSFQLIPVISHFWYADLLFDVFPVSHHEYLSAFGFALKKHFLYTGDTRPIPEVIAHFAANNEVIFHDSALEGNPSHTGVADITAYYTEEQRQRMVLYHHESHAAADAIRAHGYQVAHQGECFALGEINPN